MNDPFEASDESYGTSFLKIAHTPILGHHIFFFKLWDTTTIRLTQENRKYQCIIHNKDKLTFFKKDIIHILKKSKNKYKMHKQ